jgi:hypothetical protein
MTDKVDANNDNTPASADSSARERFIRDMYATIAFYSAHPELPAPWSIRLYVAAPTAQAVTNLAEHFDVPEYGSKDPKDGRPQMDVHVDGTDGRVGIIVNHGVVAQ